MKQVSISDFLKCNSHHEQMDIVKALFKQLNDQERELRYYKDIDMVLSHSNQYRYNIEEYDKPILLNSSDLSDNIQYLSVTITFDPNRFENLEVITEESQKKYILTKWNDFLINSKCNITELYGCFESHQSGIIHSHAIISLYDSILLKNYLLRQFSKTVRNKHCIDIKLVYDIQGILNYINKDEQDKDKIAEEKHIYRLKRHNPESLDL